MKFTCLLYVYTLMRRRRMRNSCNAASIFCILWSEIPPSCFSSLFVHLSCFIFPSFFSLCEIRPVASRRLSMSRSSSKLFAPPWIVPAFCAFPKSRNRGKVCARPNSPFRNCPNKRSGISASGMGRDGGGRRMLIPGFPAAFRLRLLHLRVV